MKLTTAEAIAELQKVDTLDMPARLCEAHYMAIKALEQECVGSTHKHVGNALDMRCDDAISRQAVQDYIAEYLSQYLYNDVREAVEVIDEYIGELPSVTPQEPKTGHWIEDEFGNKCSCCGIHIDKYMKFNYCPNCGCCMVEPQESEETDG